MEQGSWEKDQSAWAPRDPDALALSEAVTRWARHKAIFLPWQQDLSSDWNAGFFKMFVAASGAKGLISRRLILQETPLAMLLRATVLPLYLPLYQTDHQKPLSVLPHGHREHILHSVYRHQWEASISTRPDHFPIQIGIVCCKTNRS